MAKVLWINFVKADEYYEMKSTTQYWMRPKITFETNETEK